MVRRIVTISIDAELWERFKAKAGPRNASRIIEKLIRRWLGEAGGAEKPQPAPVLEERLRTLERRLEQLAVQVKAMQAPGEDAFVLLKQQGLIPEWEVLRSDIDPDDFFIEVAKRGYIVHAGAKGRIAIHPDLYDSLLSKLEELGAAPETQIKGRLTKNEYKLFNALKEAKLLFYSVQHGKWIII
ncbi:MAG: hypothetical protein DRI26_00175 [Chloroflexi bacterium]|nr:MAG: hypothetical protein DRI26_00175 [Chloroflexota bacterium]